MRDDIKLNVRAKAISDQLVDQLEMVYDTEIGLDIYNLGLIYEINLDADGHCKIITTFTEIACGCMDTVPNDIINALTQIDGINKVSVEVVWTPKWEVTRISRIGRAELGIAVR